MSYENCSIFNLEYSFLLNPNASSTFFQSNTGIWVDYTNDGTSYRMIDNLLPIQSIVNSINKDVGSNYITITEPSTNNQLISFAIHGTSQFINQAHMKILQNYNQVNFKSIPITSAEFLRIDEKFTTYLMKICQKYQVEIVLNSEKLTGKSFRDEIWLHIIGYQDNVTLAEPSLRILVSNILNSEHLDSIDIELSLIPLIGGIDLFNFNQIANQTKANIYIPDLLPNLFNSNVISNSNQLKVLITSKHVPEILLTKNILQKLVQNLKNGSFIVKEIDMQKVKLDSITLYSQSEILSIMFKHGVFIQLPSLGEANCKVIVQGLSINSVNDAVNEINLLSCNYYSIEVKGTNEYFVTQLIQLKKTCTINSNPFGIEINGSSVEIKQVLNQLSKVESLSVKLRLELSNSQRDFISGKKNGKLIKILNQLSQVPIIKFKPFNEYNFFIDLEVAGSDMMALLKGLELILLELPSELQFNVPEVFHKSIIGNGGSIIQSIMKKYNVFIKFSASTSEPSDMYTFKRLSNVLIKCPQKNSQNILMVKEEIDQLVNQCCLNNMIRSSGATTYYTVKFILLKSHYLLLINNNLLKEVSKAETVNSSYVNFPVTLDSFTSNSMIVEIKGSEAKTTLCFTQLKSLLPKNYEFKITFMPGRYEEAFITQLEEFNHRVVIPFKILLGVELIVNERSIEGDEYHQIILSYFDESKLDVAVNDLTLYLREKNFSILDKKVIEFEPLIKDASEPASTSHKSLGSPTKAQTFQIYQQNTQQVPSPQGITPLGQINLNSSPRKGKRLLPKRNTKVATRNNPSRVASSGVNSYGANTNGSPNKGQFNASKFQFGNVVLPLIPSLKYEERR